MIARRGRDLTWAATVAALALGGCAGPPSRTNGDHPGVEALFHATSVPLRRGDPVRVSGIEVGIVTSIRRQIGGVVVSMRQTRTDLPYMRLGLWPVCADAYVTVRPRIFVSGRYFMDLMPFTRRGPPLLDGDRIPASHTRVFTENLEADPSAALRAYRRLGWPRFTKADEGPLGARCPNLPRSSSAAGQAGT